MVAPQSEHRIWRTWLRKCSSSAPVTVRTNCFAKELHERREAALTPGASVIGKSAGFAQVEAQNEPLAAARTCELVGECSPFVVSMLVDLLEELNHRGRRQLDAHRMIEPQSRAS